MGLTALWPAWAAPSEVDGGRVQGLVGLEVGVWGGWQHWGWMGRFGGRDCGLWVAWPGTLGWAPTHSGWLSGPGLHWSDGLCP